MARRQPIPSVRLVTGGKLDHCLPHLCGAINSASEVDMAVAFVKSTGLRLLLPDLLAQLKPGEEGGPPARVRVVTSDYLDVTDPEALRSLMLLQDDGAQVRVYESAGSSFHTKAYLFATQDADGRLCGQEPIGLYLYIGTTPRHFRYCEHPQNSFPALEPRLAVRLPSQNYMLGN